MKSLFKSLLPVLLVFVFVACDEDDDAPAQQNITQIVTADANFSILEAAVVKANLAAALSTGNLTVFAPDNAAFAASGITEAAINSFPVSRVDSILKYHVLGSKVASGSVPASDTVKTLLGLNLYASRNGNGTFVNGIKVKTADVAASNGTIHVISKVLLPPTTTIAGVASADTSFSLLVAAVQRAGLLTAVSSAGKYTVFAPTNAAFRAAGFFSAADINAAPQATITNIVKYHVLTTNVFAGDLTNGATATTLQGGTVTINLTPARVKVTTSSQAAANIVVTDLVATNGVIHVIDKVLMP